MVLRCSSEKTLFPIALSASQIEFDRVGNKRKREGKNERERKKERERKRERKREREEKRE
jgi:hypothetical protein